MIDIPVAEIISTITAEKGLAESEVRTKIAEKLEQLSGLISEDGAAHIVANELGVTLVQKAAAPTEAKIADLAAGMRDVAVPGKVTRLFELREFNSNGRQGKVASFLMNDGSGTIRVTLWNEQTDLFSKVKEGDVVRVTSAAVKENRGYKELHLNSGSGLEINPAGVEIAVQERGARVRKPIKELTGEEQDLEILGTIVQVYDPRFFTVCPECNKRVTESAEGATCATHGAVTPQTNYVVSAFLDDGTGTLRTTFWKQQTQKLLGKDDAAILAYQDAPASFEEEKTALLGEIVKVVGRCKKNEQFERIEFTANMIYKDVNPEEELARLQAAKGAESAAAPATETAPSESITASSAPAAEEQNAPAESPKEADTVASPAAPPPEAESLSSIDADVQSNAQEEVISLDDLEDLDEKL